MDFKRFGRHSLLDKKIFAAFEGGEGSVSLPELCFDLRSEQEEAWDDLRQGSESFKNIRERLIACGKFSVLLQHNPRRLKSATADVGLRDQTERRCFLCLDQLPEGQKGILYRSEYLILCNPMPILSSHFTVSHVDHLPQAIDDHVETLLLLMADLGSGWTVLYNGPKCGASAPDHFHFQAALSGKMSIEKNLREERRYSPPRQIDGVLLYRVKELGREVVVLEGRDPTVLAEVFRRLLHAFRKVLRLNDEPMINVVGFCEEKKWRLVIFPRRKHRPNAFFREGEARRVISPGAIDMGGLLIAPMAEDFERLDAVAVESIYKEVSLEGTTVEKAIDTIPQRA